MVNLNEIENFAKSLIAEYCPAYRFVWSNAKTIHGQCNYRKKLIKLSMPYVKVANQDQIFNTITHEIAHAVVGVGHHHNFVWRAMHIKLGGNGERCSEVSVPREMSANYLLSCTGECWTAKYIRRPKTVGRICKKCRGGLVVKAI